jgi:hypothetical protein
LLLWLHSSRRPVGVKIVVGALILIVWQNLHPSVLVAGVALGAFLASDAWDWWRGRGAEPLFTTATLIVLVAVCQFATPMGLDILAISKRNAELSLGLEQPAREWLPAWDDRIRNLVLPSFGLAIAVTLILLARVSFRARAADLLLLGVMTGLAAFSFRFGLFMAVALVPAWARLLQQALPATMFPEKVESTGPPVGFLAPAAVLAAVMTAALSVSYRSELFAQDVVPDRGVQWLRKELPDGRIYNFQPYGGPLIWAGFPDWHVMMDGRIYMFSNPEWDAYYNEAAGKVPVDAIVNRDSPDVFFLHPQVQAGLIARLQAHPQWDEAYSDGVCSIFLRKKAGSSVASLPKELMKREGSAPADGRGERMATR